MGEFLYATDWSTIKDRWDLTVIQTEHDAHSDMLSTCEGAHGAVATGERRCFVVAELSRISR